MSWPLRGDSGEFCLINNLDTSTALAFVVFLPPKTLLPLGFWLPRWNLPLHVLGLLSTQCWHVLKASSQSFSCAFESECPTSCSKVLSFLLAYNRLEMYLPVQMHGTGSLQLRQERLLLHPPTVMRISVLSPAWASESSVFSLLLKILTPPTIKFSYVTRVCLKFYHYSIWIPWLKQQHFFTNCSAGSLIDLSPWFRLSLVPGVIRQVFFSPCSIVYFFLVWIWYVDFVIASHERGKSTEKGANCCLMLSLVYNTLRHSDVTILFTI